MASIDLLDVNVWVALSVPKHPHHLRASYYWQNEASARVAFNSHTMLGLVRVVSNAAVFGGQQLTVDAAWQLYRAWRKDQAVMFAVEPSRCNAVLDGMVVSGLVQRRTWSDAYLASFAEAGGLRLVSFDSDFSLFPNLSWLQLRP